MLRPGPLATGWGPHRPSYLTPACELEKIDIPTFSPYSARMNSVFMNSILDPTVWDREVAKQYSQRHGVAVMRSELDARDYWNGEEPGDYSEPVAWGKVMGIRVAKVERWGNKEFVIFGPSIPHRSIPLCSPRALLEQMKRFANDYLVPKT